MRLQRYLLAGLSGVLLVLPFPGINMSYLAWVALVPLLVAIYDADWKQSLRLGFVTGIIYVVGTLNWFMVIYPFSSLFWVTLGFVALVIYLSTYVLIFTVSVNFVTRYWIIGSRSAIFGIRDLKSKITNPLAYSFLVAIVWTAMEILKGYVATGLPWADLCHTQWRHPILIQICSLTGMYGLTFLIAMVNGAIANFLVNIRGWRTSLRAAVVPAALLVVSLIYGLVTLSLSSQGEKIKVALVPGNIDQMAKLRSWRDPGWIFDKYVRITERAVVEKPDLIVWPETSVPDYMFRWGATPIELKSLVEKWNAYFLIGIPHIETLPELKSYNAVFLLSPTGEEIGKYYKIHLVPVSEYFPMKQYLPDSWQELVTGISDWDKGERYTIFDTPQARLGCVICFESIFPNIFRKFVGSGVNVMGIITNDAWFKGTYAPEQHYSAAPFRAVENRTGIFRCANGGISCIIDPWGRIRQEMWPDVDEGYLVGEVCLRSGGTLYTRFGDYLPWACLVMTVFVIFRTWWHDKARDMRLEIRRAGCYQS